MKKRLMAMLLISVLVLSCISINIAAVDRPLVSLDNMVLPAGQNTTDLIYVPIRITHFIENCVSIQLTIEFDNTQLVYSRTLQNGNIPSLIGDVPTWFKNNLTAETYANAHGSAVMIFDNDMEDPYVNENIIPGTQDIMTYIAFKRKAGSDTGKKNVLKITEFLYSSSTAGEYTTNMLDYSDGSITFGEAATATPEPTAEPATATPEPTAEPATATPEPTAEPATATPEPTAEPATATPEPTAVPDHTITVSVDDTKGMVLNMDTGKAVKNGQTVAVSDGASAQFKVVAYGGYKIDQVIYNGGAPAGNGMFKNVVNTGEVTTDTSLSVTFASFAPGDNPVVDSYDNVFVATENSENIAVSYGTVHGTYAATGIIMWNTADSATDVSLEQALAAVPTVDSNRMYVFSATSGTVSKGLNNFGQFGVMVKSLPVGIYKMRTYVLRFEKVTYGDTIQFEIK